LGGFDPLERILPEMEGKVAAYDIINCVPWHTVFPDKETPLAPYNLIGGVSGRPIQDFARRALVKAMCLTNTPIISGGGIDSEEEVEFRFALGAKAVAIGSMFLRKPWLPNRIVTRQRKNNLARVNNQKKLLFLAGKVT